MPAGWRRPTVTAKARNHYALAMKREAALLGIPIFETRRSPAPLFRSCDDRQARSPAIDYRDVAALYIKLRASP